MNEPAKYYRRTVSKEEINVLPILNYIGEVRLIQTEDELIEIVKLLEHETVLGFDTESRPSFKKGKSYPTSLVQFAASEFVVLVRLSKVPLGRTLAKLLSCPKIIKVGVAIHEDIRLLQKLYPFEAGGIVDLAEMARRLDIKAQGIRTLAAHILGGRITKTVQCSNWEKEKLSYQQIRYAATDAWVGRELYFRLCELGA